MLQSSLSTQTSNYSNYQALDPYTQNNSQTVNSPKLVPQNSYQNPTNLQQTYQQPTYQQFPRSNSFSNNDLISPTSIQTGNMNLQPLTVQTSNLQNQQFQGQSYQQGGFQQAFQNYTYQQQGLQPLSPTLQNQQNLQQNILTNNGNMSNALLIKDIASDKDLVFYDRICKNFAIKKTPKIGTCWNNSVVFDDYFEEFEDKGVFCEPEVRAITFYHNDTQILGVACDYEILGKSMIGPTHMNKDHEILKQATLKLQDGDGLSEVSGYLDSNGQICGLTLVSWGPSGKQILTVGGVGPTQFSNILPKSLCKLHGIGGSHRQYLDSLYFYIY